MGKYNIRLDVSAVDHNRHTLFKYLAEVQCLKNTHFCINAELHNYTAYMREVHFLLIIYNKQINKSVKQHEIIISY